MTQERNFFVIQHIWIWFKRISINYFTFIYCYFLGFVLKSICIHHQSEMYRHRGFNHFNPSSLFNIYCRYYRTRQNYESYSSRNSFFYTRGICVWVTCKTLYSNVHLSSWLFTGYKIINILQATSRGVYIMFLACWSVSPQFCFYVSTTFLKPLDRIL